MVWKVWELLNECTDLNDRVRSEQQMAAETPVSCAKQTDRSRRRTTSGDHMTWHSSSSNFLCVCMCVRTLDNIRQLNVQSSRSVCCVISNMLALINRLLDWFRSLFWKEEMELTLVGLQSSGKTTFVNVIAVSLWGRISSLGALGPDFGYFTLSSY